MLRYGWLDTGSSALLAGTRNLISHTSIYTSTSTLETIHCRVWPDLSFKGHDDGS